MSLKERRKVLITSLIIGFLIIGIIATVFTIGKVTADTENLSSEDYVQIEYTEEIIKCEACQNDYLAEIIWEDCTTNAKKTIVCTNEECSNFGVRVTCEEDVQEALGHDISYTSDAAEHTEQCSRCDYTVTEEHNIEWTVNEDGTHTGTCSDCGYIAAENETHTMGEWTIDTEDSTKHTRVCTTGCGYTEEEEHTCSAVDNGNGTHTIKCEKNCGYEEETEEHSCNIEDNGNTHTLRCVKGCGYSGVTAEHYKGDTPTVVEYQDMTSEEGKITGHKVIYKCAELGCTGKVEEEHVTIWINNEDGTHKGTCESCEYTKENVAHSGATHGNGGKCEYCDEQYEIHEKTGEATYEVTENGHKATYSCSFENCDEKIEETEEHSGANHANGGICEKCEAQYETHEKTGDPIRYTSTETTHSAIYNCAVTGCTVKITEEHTTKWTAVEGKNTHSGTCDICIYTEEEEEHTMEEWSIDTEDVSKHTRECSKCGYKEKQDHTKGEETYEETENGHKVTYKCDVEGCLGTTTEEHTTVWKTNDDKVTHTGTCDTCGFKKENQEHTWTVIKDEEYDSSGHIIECSICKYRQQANHNNEIINKGNTHALKCMDNCGYEVEEEHYKKENATPVEYKDTENRKHVAIYNCAVLGCTGQVETEHETVYTDNGDGTHTEACNICEYTKEKTAHSGATHENGGKCQYCEVQYERHEKKEGADPIEYKEGVNGGHIAIYACSIEGCAEKIEDTEENHSGATHDNGGICEKCEKQYEEHIKTGHPAFVTEDTKHKLIYACSFEGCEEEIIEEHETKWTLDEDDNSKHIGTCDTEEGCNYLKAEEHTMESWALDTEDETKHSSTCKCGYKETKDHEKGEATYEDTEEGHKVTYACSVEGCTGVIIENHETKWEQNEDDTSKHIGTCDEEEACNYTKTEDHIMGEWTIDTEDNTKHTSTCKCGHKESQAHEKGEATYEDTEEGHKVTYACSVEGCTGEIIENHKTKWTPKEDDTSKHIGTCDEEEACNYTKTEDHTMGEWTIDTEDATKHTRECSECGHKESQAHEKGEATYEDTEEGHKVTYACSIEGCTGEIIENHKTKWTPKEDDTSKHIGTCDEEEACNYTKTEDHIMGEWALDKEDNTKHTKTCKCGHKESQAHEKGEATYEDTEEGHKVTYTCIVEGCTGVITENHKTKWTPKEDDTSKHIGTCDEEENCNYTKTEDHIMGEWTIDTQDNTKHTSTCKCGHKESQAHKKGEDAIPIKYKKGENRGHIPVYACIVEGCEGEVYGEEEDHEKASHTNGGKCEKCKEVYEVHEKTGDATYEKTETGHKAIYACSFEGCSEKIEELGAHSVSDWEDDERGTHSGICSICKFSVTENHSNGTTSNCTKCDYTVNNTEDDENGNNGNTNNGNNDDGSDNNGNTNDDNDNTGDNNQGNTNEGDENTGNDNDEGTNGGNSNNGNNNNGNGNSNGGTTNNNSGLKDETQATSPIPQTGVNSIVIISSIVALIGLAVTMTIKLKGYKDVK